MIYPYSPSGSSFLFSPIISSPRDQRIQAVALPRIRFPLLECPPPKKEFRILENGDRCLGIFTEEGAIQGPAIYINTKGERYEGHYVDSLIQGPGKAFLEEGIEYEGDFLDGEASGEGKYIYKHGDCIRGIFEKGKLREIDLPKELGSKCFIGLLLGRFESGMYVEYPLNVLSQFLLRNGNVKPGEALRSALEIYFEKDAGVASKRILLKVQAGESQVLLYFSEGHALGLQLVPKDDGYVDFEIYNSGLGLNQYHEANPDLNKYQTRLVVRIPLEALNEEWMESAIRSNTQTIEDAYERILNFPGAEKQKAEREVWQTQQKGFNCSLEWIFAYLKNTLSPSEYNAMRLELFRSCFQENIRQCDKRFKDPRAKKLRIELARKIAKREQRGLEYRKGRKDDKPDFVASHHSSNAAR